MAVFNAQTITIDVERPLAEVYEYLADPNNFPSWASGLGGSFEPLGGMDWATDAPAGRIVFRFAERNPHGILDHLVLREAGEPMPVPMRVVANGEGTQVIYTLFRHPGFPEQQLRSDAALVTSDLMGLKRLLESR